MGESYAKVVADVYAAAFEDIKNGEDVALCFATAVEAMREVSLWEI